jgi:hypothetical protein
MYLKDSGFDPQQPGQTFFKIRAVEMSANKMSVDKMLVDKMSADKVSADKLGGETPS